MADPGPVAQTFFVDDTVRAKAQLDGFLTVVDAKHIVQHLDEVKPDGAVNEAVQQVAFADVLILNKTDLVSAEELKTVEDRIRAVNKTAKLIKTSYSKVDLKEILAIRAFSLERILDVKSDLLEDFAHSHDDNVNSIGITLEGQVDLDPFGEFMQHFLQSNGENIYRSKGIIAVAGMDRKVGCDSR